MSAENVFLKPLDVIEWWWAGREGNGKA